MRKIIIYTLSMVLSAILLCGSVASATFIQIERLTPHSPDYAELTALTDRVVDEINELQEFSDSGIHSDVTAADIDWSQAYKRYVDESDIYTKIAAENLTYDEIVQAMDYYVWMLPVHVDDAHLTVILSIGLELAEDDPAREVLTEQEIQQLEADTGKWHPVAIQEAELTAQMYEQQIQEAYSGEITHMFILGGSPKLRSAVAIIETPDKSMKAIPLEQPRIIGDLNAESAASANTTSANIALEPDTVYSMEEIASILDQYTLDPYSDQIGAGGMPELTDSSNKIVFAILGVSIIGLAVIYYVKKRKYDF